MKAVWNEVREGRERGRQKRREYPGKAKGEQIIFKKTSYGREE